MRVRFSYLADDDIRDLARTYGRLRVIDGEIAGRCRMSSHPTPSRTHRIEGVALVLILLTVAGLAGAASFTHVNDWTLANSPAGTGDGSAGPTPSSPNSSRSPHCSPSGRRRAGRRSGTRCSC